MAVSQTSVDEQKNIRNAPSNDKRSQSSDATYRKLPPLENGDRLTREEFERRYDAMPDLKKAELINGVVYIPYSADGGRLENGARLTREEFERLYDAQPQLKKAELINGVVYMGSPVRFGNHGEPHAELLTWLGTYSAFTRGVRLGDNVTVRLGSDADPQPDALLRIEPQAGGRSHISADDYVEGAPELIVEIAASTASHDLHDKLDVYRQSGVQEYLVWRVYDEQIDWFALQDGEYIRLTPDESGVIHSQVFPGLRLALSALLAGEIAQVLAELQKGLGTAEYADFVERLGESEQAAN